ncbi:MAG: M48 family metalloprotease [Acidobacteria bacterium]|nr:M48 family metalloprotease [Acidobacteriota bacterium]
MPQPRLLEIVSVAMLLLAMPLSHSGLFAQTKVKPGINVFSLEQDIEMGREASKEIEQQLPMLDDPATVSYVSTLGKSLASKSDKPDLPWEFKVVNAADVNAFALPGGFIYVNRGLIETAASEAQLAGVLSHEISHVTLRHGTNQVSKSLMVQMPLSVLGGAIGKGGWKGALTQVGISAGMALALSKFSRTDETQADILGTQLMTKAGYDPHQLAGMFQTLKKLQDSEPSRLELWFASHPDPSNRIERIEKEIGLIRVPQHPVVNTPKFSDVQSRVKRMPPAPKPVKKTTADASTGTKPAPPSATFRTYRNPQGWFGVSYPENWRISDEGDTGVLFSPEGGVVESEGQVEIRYGTMINLFDPAAAASGAKKPTLQQAAGQFIESLQKGNPHLRESGKRRTTRLAGAEAVSAELSGTPSKGPPETVSLITRWYNARLLYLIFISPTEDKPAYQDAFRRITRTLAVYKVK